MNVKTISEKLVSLLTAYPKTTVIALAVTHGVAFVLGARIF